MEFKIRSLQKKDAGQAAELILQLTKNIVDPQHLAARIRKLAVSGNSKFLVAESEGKVVAFGGLAWYVIPSKGLIAWIEEVVVDEYHRGKGIGRALMEKVLFIAQAKNIKQIKLTSSTPVSKNLYVSLGFSQKDHDYMFKNLF
ncbi:GNAT family N-acetyltransferase [Candidatus Parcubacteria bacterium]|nr:GNAT family N-acetyltransferase [Candidatus Parcubacteria bacterium]